MKNAVKISVICPDHLRVWASNGMFVGETEVFANPSKLSRFVSALRGFPVNGSDRRDCELGTFVEALGGGGAAFRFSCMDSIGHALVEVRLRTDPRLGFGASDLATIHISIEAALVDAFVGQLERMLLEPSQSAVLEAAG